MKTSDEARRESVTSQHNAAVINDAVNYTPPGSWLEMKLRPKKITSRYPFKGKPLLFTTSAFGGLGDALFGYNSGKF
jgi:hypothetical protein